MHVYKGICNTNLQLMACSKMLRVKNWSVPQKPTPFNDTPLHPAKVTLVLTFMIISTLTFFILLLSSYAFLNTSV